MEGNFPSLLRYLSYLAPVFNISCQINVKLCHLFTQFSGRRDSGVLEMLTWILCIIVCFFVIGFFCDLTEYQAAILHLKREHKEEIENLQVYLFDSPELVMWDSILSFLMCRSKYSPFCCHICLDSTFSWHLPVDTVFILGREDLNSIFNISQFLVHFFSSHKCIWLGRWYAWRKYWLYL